MLQVRDLHVAHGEIEALKGVTLEVRDGEIVAVLGANGAGKTTLLRAISGLLPVRGGEIVWDETTAGRPAWARRRGAGTTSKIRAVSRSIASVGGARARGAMCTAPPSPATR